jgi:ADP-ribose pyrophosphatase
MFLPSIDQMPTSEKLYETRWLRMERIGTWDFVRRPHSDACVGILAITPNDEVVLVEQFRIPTQRHVIEIPAGIVGDEEEHRGESLANTAARELLEETGYRAGSIRQLIASPTSAGMTPEITHLFLATDLVREHQGGGVGCENITVHLVPRAELQQWLAGQEAAGKLVDFKIHASLWLAANPTPTST